MSSDMPNPQWRKEALKQIYMMMMKCMKLFMNNVFVWVAALGPSQQFVTHVGMFSWVEPVLSNEDEVSSSRTQHPASGEIQTRDLAFKSLVLYQANCGPSMNNTCRCLISNITN